MPCLRRLCPTLVLLALAGCTTDRTVPRDLAMDPDPGAVDMRAPGPATKCQVAGVPELLSNLPGEHAYPRLGFTGTHFVVAWNTRLEDGRHRIVAALTDRDGHKLGPNIALSAEPLAGDWPPSVTPMLGGTAIAWTRKGASPGETDIVMNTLDPSGQRLDAQGRPCDPGEAACGQFQVTSSGVATYPYLSRPHVDQHSAGPTDNQVSLTWIDGRNHPCASGTPCPQINDVYWKKLQANGTVLVPDRRITTAIGRFAFPRMAFDGAKNGIVWRDDAPGTSTDFYFATLEPQGVVSAAPKKIGVAMGALVAEGAPDLIWTGADYALATATGSDTSASVILQRFEANGQSTLGPIGVTFSGVACTPAITWNGRYFAVVWQTRCGQPGSDLGFELLDAEGFRLRPDGTRCGLDPECGMLRLTANGSQISSYPELAWAGGGTFVVAWTQSDVADGGARASQIYFARVECSPE